MRKFLTWAVIGIAALASACAYPQGAILRGGEMSLPRGGCGKPVCGKQTYTVHPTVAAVEVTFTNALAVPVNVTFQAPYQYGPLGKVGPSETVHFTFVRPAVYRGTRIEVTFIVQALDENGNPVAVEVVEERISRNDQILVSGISRMRLPRGLR